MGTRAFYKLRNFLPEYICFIVSLPYLLFVAPIHFQGREIIRECARRMGFTELWRKVELKLPMVGADEILHDPFGARLLFPNAEVGSVSTYEMLIINNLVRERAPRLIFEFGTFKGRTTLNLAANSPPEAKIITNDFSQYLGRLHYEGTEVAYKISRIIGDSRDLDINNYKNIDFIFVDGGHDPDIVLNDSLKAVQMVSPRGVILWHDYVGHEGVSGVLEDLARTDARFRGVCWVQDTSMAILPPK